MLPQLTISTLFPYTTLFRSNFEEPDFEIVVVFIDLRHFSDKLKINVVATFILSLSEKCRRSIKTDRKSTRLNFSHSSISYAVFCLKKKKKKLNKKYI